MGLGIGPEAAGRLAERTEGWIIGLQLAALSLQGRPDPEQFLTVERWLRALPAALIPVRPVLSVALAAVYSNQLQLDQAEQAINACRLEPSDEISASSDLRGKLQTLLGLAARMQGDKERSVVRLRQAQELLNPDNLTWRSVALYNLGIVHADRGELERGAAVLAEAIAAAEEANNPTVLLRASYACG